VAIDRTTGRLLRLLVALPNSIKHLACNPNVLLIDATYKTNRFNMPLVNTVGIDNCNRTFFISFAFMSSEGEVDYDWTLQCNLELFTLYMPSVMPSVIATDADLALIKAVRKTFPNAVALLCTWHIQKNVLKHCKGGFPTDEAWNAFNDAFNGILYARTVQEYEDWLQQFSILYAFNANPCFADDYVGYINDNWLTLVRKVQVVRAWTDQHLHFGTTVTSWIEGAHAVLKRFLDSSTGDLYTTWLGIEKAVDNQINSIRGYTATLHA
jgi:hypothetical protein